MRILFALLFAFFATSALADDCTPLLQDGVDPSMLRQSSDERLMREIAWVREKTGFREDILVCEFTTNELPNVYTLLNFGKGVVPEVHAQYVLFITVSMRQASDNTLRTVVAHEFGHMQG